MPGRQIEYFFKIEQNLMVAIILHGNFLSATGFRAVNLFTRNEEGKGSMGKCVFLTINV